MNSEETLAQLVPANHTATEALALAKQLLDAAADAGLRLVPKDPTYKEYEFVFVGDLVLVELLKMLQASTVQAALEQLQAHFDKDKRLSDNFLDIERQREAAEARASRAEHGKKESLQLASDVLLAAKAEGLELVAQPIAEFDKDTPFGERFEFRNVRASRAEQACKEAQFAKAVVNSAYDDAALWIQDGPIWKERAEAAESSLAAERARVTKLEKAMGLLDEALQVSFRSDNAFYWAVQIIVASRKPMSEAAIAKAREIAERHGIMDVAGRVLATEERTTP